ncbi:MAG TPA: DUF2807 domain-containing protein [Mucilaginibacter sp.]|jgi:hypothetical protein|nr:DUF2807 domain-containing protein [Mucilaginibacter sp.]
MKTKILSIIALLVIGSAVTKSASAATMNSGSYTILTDVNHINKIEIYGNVELYVSDGNADQVKVYNNYYSESALVQSKNGVLRISSYTADKLVVWVTAADLRTISAYDNADVKSFGSLSKIELDVDLHNNASAKLDMDAFNANVTLTDHAKADLTGNANELTVKRDKAASVNNYNFTAVHLTEKKISIPVADKDQDIAGL